MNRIQMPPRRDPANETVSGERSGVVYLGQPAPFDFATSFSPLKTLGHEIGVRPCLKLRVIPNRSR